MSKLDIPRVWAWSVLASFSLAFLGCAQHPQTEAQSQDPRVVKALQIKAKTLMVRDLMTEAEVVQIMGKPAGVYDHPQCDINLGVGISRELVFDVSGSRNAQFVVGLGVLPPYPPPSWNKPRVQAIGFRVQMVANGAPPAEIIQRERFWKWLEHGPADEWLEVDWLTR